MEQRSPLFQNPALLALMCFIAACGSEQPAIIQDHSKAEEGQHFPPFIAISLQGSTVDNTYFTDKITLVSAWRLGCKWSMKEIPEYNRLANSISDPRFQIISMAPQTRDELEAFYDPGTHGTMVNDPDIRTEIPQYDVLPMCSMKRLFDPDTLGAQCAVLNELIGADVLPVTFIVGPDGIIRHRHDGLIVDPDTYEADISLFRNDLDSLLRVL